MLKKWGATVIHKLHMHEKLVFVDDEILWAGSLNPLSFSSTQEIMERRRSRKIVEDYAKTLRLDQLLRLHDEHQDECPVCGQEVMAAEGRDEPFYWRCIEKGCHTRSIDQPAPRDGRIICSNCGGPLYFGEWGGEPFWRCDKNARHRQRIVLNHLRLPKMQDLIAPRELSRLEERLRRREP